MRNVVCPVSNKQIDSHVSRLTIFLNVVLMVLFLYTQQIVFMGIVALDYFIRGCLQTRHSPLGFIARAVVRQLKIRPKMVGAAPKVFVSRLGAAMAVSVLILITVGQSAAALSIAVVLTSLATAASVFNVCIGCLLYNYLVLPFAKQSSHKKN